MRKILFLAASGMVIFSVSVEAKPKPALECVANPIVEIKTTMGEIDVKLKRAKAPISVENFVQYVNSKFYDNKIFHRVMPGFMIQGGGFDKDLKEAETKAPIKNEANNKLTNDKYTISMARTNIPDSATAQFFINVNDNTSLDFSPSNPGYAVFGKVIKGQDVVDKIAATPTKTSGMYENVPVTPVIIKSAKMRPCK